MAFTRGALGVGVRQVVVTPLTGDKQPVTSIASVQFAPVYNSSTLQGNDQTNAVDSILIHYTWSLDTGGMDLPLKALLEGLTILPSGTYPNRRWTLGEKVGEETPYFRMDIRVAADDGGDIVATLHNCKIDAGSGGGSYGEYWTPSYSGKAIARGTSPDIATIQVRETASELSV